jgi:glyoxylate carboligase
LFWHLRTRRNEPSDRHCHGSHGLDPDGNYNGQVGRASIGTDAFQETDIYGITLPIVKHSYVVRDPKDMGRIVAEAFLIASTGRPGTRPN